MKQLLFLLITTIISTQDHAQIQFWGMAQFGGQYEAGVIFKTDSSGNNQTVSHHFFQTEGEGPYYTHLIQTSDGKLYGMTRYGGKYNYGTIFQYDPVTSIHIKKFDFNDTNGSYPHGSLYQASDGKLYGMTERGGLFDMGILFQFDPASSTFQKKFDFNDTNGSYPKGSLMQASDGKLYGMTNQGGTKDSGVIFQYDPLTTAYVKKIDFTGVGNGSFPRGALMQASDGMLYGMAVSGGNYNRGVLFQYNPATSSCIKKVDFAGASNGAEPYGSLMQASDGKLYGVTGAGGVNSEFGTIFQYNPVTSTLSKKYDFDGAPNGGAPVGTLIQASDGKLYGTAFYGGSSLKGVLFQFDPVTFAYIKKVNFGTATGYTPHSKLLQASDGMLYGMAMEGGTGDRGILFQYNTANGAITKKLDFAGAPYGSYPIASLMQASDGKFYGITTRGGSYGKGALFQYAPFTGSIVKKADFSAQANGTSPLGSLIQASDGKLYGMTSNGGINNLGVIFQYDPVTSIYVKKIDFTGTNGQYPTGALMQASDGKLYGTTPQGGLNGSGVLFQFDPVTSSFMKKADLGTIGGEGQGTLIQAADGKLYGMSAIGGSYGFGILFQYDPLTSTITKKYDFDGANGKNPTGALTQGTDGKLYGVTTLGGANGYGVIFRYDIATNAYVKKFDFGGATNGREPCGSLMRASNGKLYGMTNKGGIIDKGVMFQFDPVTSTFTKKFDFTGSNGLSPRNATLIETAAPTITTVALTSSAYCPGSMVNIPYTVTGVFDTANVFTAQLSDSGGAFAAPINIGSMASSSSGTIAAIIPQSSMYGTAYRIRVVSNNPIITGNNNGSNITVYPKPSVGFTMNDSAQCLAGNVFLFNDTSATTVTRLWDFGDLTSGNMDSLGKTYNNTGKYVVRLKITDVHNCSDSLSKSVTVKPNPAKPFITMASPFVLQSTVAGSYLWYFNNTLIPNATGQTLTVAQNGNYIVRIDSSNGCGNLSDPFAVTSVAVKEIITDDGIKVYPNPATEELFIEFQSPRNSDEVSIEIIDMKGSICIQGHQTIKSGNPIHLKIHDLTSGLYFVLINNRAFKFVKSE